VTGNIWEILWTLRGNSSLSTSVVSKGQNKHAPDLTPVPQVCTGVHYILALSTEIFLTKKYFYGTLLPSSEGNMLNVVIVFAYLSRLCVYAFK